MKQVSLSKAKFADIIISEVNGSLDKAYLRIDDRLAKLDISETDSKKIVTLGKQENCCELLDFMDVFTRIRDKGRKETIFPASYSISFDKMRYRVEMSVPEKDIDARKYNVRKGAENLIPFEDLGYLRFHRELILNLVQNHSGLILFAGSVGSGKTTTAFSLLEKCLRNYGKLGLSYQDPIEYELEDEYENGSRLGVYQGFEVPKNELGEANWDKIVASIKRSRARYVLLGEIRDEQSARAALEATKSGALVISTIHASEVIETHDGPSGKTICSALRNLISMAVTSTYPEKTALNDLATSLIGVFYQSLVEEKKVTKAYLKEFVFTRPVALGSEADILKIKDINSSAIAQYINEGNINSLADKVISQTNIIKNYIAKHDIESRKER